MYEIIITCSFENRNNYVHAFFWIYMPKVINISIKFRCPGECIWDVSMAETFSHPGPCEGWSWCDWTWGSNPAASTIGITKGFASPMEVFPRWSNAKALGALPYGGCLKRPFLISQNFLSYLFKRYGPVFRPFHTNTDGLTAKILIRRIPMNMSINIGIRHIFINIQRLMG